VVVDDSLGRMLFAHQLDSTITREVAAFKNGGFPQLQRFYFQDEPWPPSFLPSNYADQRIFAEGFTTTRGRGITANGWTENSMQRFLLPPTQQPDTILHLENATVYFYDKDITRLKEILR